MSDGERQATGMDRRDLLRLSGLIAALLVLVAVALLLGGSGESKTTPGRVEGILTTVEENRLVLQPENGAPPEEFTIRPEDRRALDMFHLRQHSADRLPSIVHYEETDGTKYALRVDDA
jgi:hypothetical protein